jgi:2-dehydro-3-deoxyphosphogluconate aldolase/(4S)-4-hydroxy-2-oxoglutarate aldolase
MRVVELTRSTPDVESALRELTEEGLLVGVGTIADARYIESAVAAGARFVVSFANPRGFVAAARAAGVPAIPGALTPSEIAAAAASGADAVKIFPASTVSPSYLVSLRPVLPDVKLVVTGGIRATAEDIHPWLSAGALAVGVGGLAEAETEDDITSRAASLLTQLDA